LYFHFFENWILIEKQDEKQSIALSPQTNTSCQLAHFLAPESMANGQLPKDRTDRTTCTLPHYRGLFDNVRSRRRNHPKPTHYSIYRDLQTPTLPLGEKGPECICLDHVEVRMGSSSLQTTFQTSNEAECRWLYDQLIVDDNGIRNSGIEMVHMMVHFRFAGQSWGVVTIETTSVTFSSDIVYMYKLGFT
jgi:hypothetical protein